MSDPKARFTAIFNNFANSNALLWAISPGLSNIHLEITGCPSIVAILAFSGGGNELEACPYKRAFRNWLDSNWFCASRARISSSVITSTNISKQFWLNYLQSTKNVSVYSCKKTCYQGEKYSFSYNSYWNLAISG